MVIADVPVDSDPADAEDHWNWNAIGPDCALIQPEIRAFFMQ